MKNLPLRITLTRIGEPDLAQYGLALTPVDSPQAAAEFWKSAIASQPDHEAQKEHLAVILLDTKLRPIGWNLVAVGSLNECTAHPREIFRPAIAAAAYGMVLLHNHPSGDPSPSQADRRMTSNLREAAQILQVNLIDHIVIGHANGVSPVFFSFRDAGLL